MKLLNLTLNRPSENLSLDEALVETADRIASDETPHDEVLRLWEPTRPMVVIGRSSPLDAEVDVAWCANNEIPVFRRSSGGASIVTGPGCLMYAVLLDLNLRPHLRMLDQAHQFVMQTMAKALESIDVATEIKGTCDLTIADRKVSGNSLRVKRNFLIYHGTMICDFDTKLISACLKTPARQPDYRNQRKHEEFVAALPVSTTTLASAISTTWNALEPLTQWPQAMTEKLASEKYETREWLERVN